MNALHHAAKWGHTNVLKYLLSAGRCKVNTQDKVSNGGTMKATVLTLLSPVVWVVSFTLGYLEWTCYNNSRST